MSQAPMLDEPLVLLVLVFGVPFVLLGARARLRQTSPAQRAGILVTRLIMLSLLVLALAQPVVRPASDGRAVVFAVDASDSVTPDQLAWARAWVERAIAGLPAGSQSDVVEFGARAQLAGALQTLPTGSTNLSSALTLA